MRINEHLTDGLYIISRLIYIITYNAKAANNACFYAGLLVGFYASCLTGCSAEISRVFLA